MARTKANVEAELATVNSAIGSVMSGEKINELVIGSGEFQRTYKFQQVNLDSLLILRTELTNELFAYLPDAEPTFRAFGSIPLVMGKAGVR